MRVFVIHVKHVLQKGMYVANIRLDVELERRLDFLAKETGRTKSFYIRKALEETIEDLEDLYLARHRVEALGNVSSLKEVRKEFGLDH